MRYSIVIFNNNNLKSNIEKINQKLENFNYDIIVLNLDNSFRQIIDVKNIYVEDKQFKNIVKFVLNHTYAPYIIFINSNENSVIEYLDQILINFMKSNNIDNKNQMLVLQSKSCNCFQKKKNLIYAFVKNIIKKLDLNQNKDIFEIYQDNGYKYSIQYIT